MTPSLRKVILEDPLYAAIRMLTEAAEELRACHTLPPGDWTGEPEAKAHYDCIMTVVNGLEKLRQDNEHSANAGATKES